MFGFAHVADFYYCRHGFWVGARQCLLSSVGILEVKGPQSVNLGLSVCSWGEGG